MEWRDKYAMQLGVSGAIRGLGVTEQNAKGKCAARLAREKDKPLSQRRTDHNRACFIVSTQPEIDPIGDVSQLRKDDRAKLCIYNQHQINTTDMEFEGKVSITMSDEKA
jgi:hypothetical protein